MNQWFKQAVALCLSHFRKNSTHEKRFIKTMKVLITNYRLKKLIFNSSPNRSEQLFYLIEKNTNAIIEQTKTKQQESLDFKLSRSSQTLSFITPLTLEKDIWMMGITSLEIFETVFKMSQD